MNDTQKCIDLLTLVAQSLGDLRSQIVFIGGITTFAYLNSPTALEVRPTEDVDCTIEIASIIEYKKLESKLISLGFKHDTSKATHICRWTIHGVKVDIMPTEEKILGFTNRWYSQGIKNKIKFTLPSQSEIFIFSLPYFLGSKLEAYRSRGQEDPRTSTDIEDILLILDGNKEVTSSIRSEKQEVQDYLAKNFSDLFQSNLFDETIESLFSQEGIERIRKIKGLVLKIINKHDRNKKQ